MNPEIFGSSIDVGSFESSKWFFNMLLFSHQFGGDAWLPICAEFSLFMDTHGWSMNLTFHKISHGINNDFKLNFPRNPDMVLNTDIFTFSVNRFIESLRYIWNADQFHAHKNSARWVCRKTDHLRYLKFIQILKSALKNLMLCFYYTILLVWYILKPVAEFENYSFYCQLDWYNSKSNEAPSCSENFSKKIDYLLEEDPWSLRTSDVRTSRGTHRSWSLNLAK